VPTKKVHLAAAIKWRLWVDCVEKVPAARRRDRLIREPNAPRNDDSLNGG
jgi:hypothetical protein